MFIALFTTCTSHTERFWRSLDVTINALDNFDARLYIDRLCVRNGVQLLEAGTEGVEAVSYSIVPHETNSYEVETAQQRQGNQNNRKGKKSLVEFCVCILCGWSALVYTFFMRLHIVFIRTNSYSACLMHTLSSVTPRCCLYLLVGLSSGAIPMCTLRNFPHILEHCIEWARDLFALLFAQLPQTLHKLLALSLTTTSSAPSSAVARAESELVSL